MTDTPPEFSRRILVDQISTAGIEQHIEATPEECAALAQRFGLRSIGRLSASLRLKAMAGGTLFRVRGTLSAAVVQTCVVTLEPVPATVDEELEVTFGGSSEDEEGSLEIDFSMDEADPPDPIVEGAIDLGEVVAEYLALALDPFPRKPGAVMDQPPPQEVFEEKRPSPFAALEKLRQKKG